MKIRLFATALTLLGLLGLVGQGSASAPATEGTPFQILGYIQKFTLFNVGDLATFCPGSGVTVGSGLEGAKMTVNGIEFIIPCNTIVTMPATYLTPTDIFDYAPAANKALSQSGLALEDTPPPLAAMEVSLDGNIVTIPGGGLGAGVRHVAGMVHISQQSLNNGAGYINTIDADGTLHVGSSLTPNPTADALVRINDAEGRFGLQTSFLGPGLTPPADVAGEIMITQDGRFTADTGNPTIHAETGYPMCIPRGAGDALCPLNNRPIDPSPALPPGTPRSFFVMGTQTLLPPSLGDPPIPACGPLVGPSGPQCDPTQQAPLMVGDYINYSGTLATGHPSDPPKTIYVSAHTIAAWVAIYTDPSAPVAYITQEVSLMGTGGRTTDIVPDPLAPGGAIAQEVAPRTIKVEGSTTDPSRLVIVSILNYLSTTTAPSGVSGSGPTPGVVGSVGTQPAPFGRFRFIVTRLGVQKILGSPAPASPPTFNVASPVKEVRVSVQGVAPSIVANGLTAGQFDAPMSEFIFAENTFFGQSLVPFNFHRFCYLAVGSGVLTTAGRTSGITVGQLAPWPENAGINPGTTFGPPLPAPGNPDCP